MTRPISLNTTELIDFIADKICNAADWRDGFADLIDFVGTRLAAGSGFIRLYHYIAGRYFDSNDTVGGKTDSVVDAVFEQMAEERAPIALPSEYSGYLRGEMQYCVVGIPFIRNGEYLGGLVFSGGEGEHIREQQFRDLTAAMPYLVPIFESAVLQEILLSNYLETIETLAVALEAKDSFTRGHSNMVCAYSMAIARKMGFDRDRLRAMEIGSMMHDIGKIGVPDHILLKTGKLTDEEFAIVKQHPVIGEEILKPMRHPLFEIPRRIVRWHHERLDGKGYPDGLKGDEIPLEARITFVADAYDAMASDRPFRAAFPQEKAFTELMKNSGTQFDRDVVEVLCSLMSPLKKDSNTGEKDVKDKRGDTGMDLRKIK